MKKFLIYFIFLTAISLAGIVAYVSITGLLTVFSGVGFLGLLFFLTIEMSKIIATSAIHTYGNKISIFVMTLAWSQEQVKNKAKLCLLTYSSLWYCLFRLVNSML